MQVLAARTISLKISCAGKLQSSLVRWPKIRRPAEEPWDILRQHIQHLARSVPPSNPLSVGRKNREITVPSHWELPPLHELDFVCQFGMPGAISFHQRYPFLPQTRAACAYARREMFETSIGNKTLFFLAT